MELVEKRVMAALERAGYVGDDTLLVVAVSGGPDSLALLHSLATLRTGRGPGLHVAHLNHDFRGEEADEDARFVATVASELGLSWTVEKADPIAHQKEMGISSFEEAAREVRYEFLTRVAGHVGAVAVALGHTSDDLAETVLMHVMRGSGTYGLRGMTELTPWIARTARSGQVQDQKAVLFRPLLDLTKAETVGYCRKRGVAFREDPGNRLPRFARNRVRHELLPAMEAYNPRIREALVRLAHSASLEVEYLEQEVVGIWPTVASREADSIVLNTRALSSIHPFMQRMVLRRAYQQLAGDTKRLEEVHLKAAVSCISAPPGRVLELPRGFRLVSGYGELRLGIGIKVDCPYPALSGEHEIPLPSTAVEVITEVSGWRVAGRILVPDAVSPTPGIGPGNPFTACLNLDATGRRLWIRARLPGDRVQPLGMQGEKKLQDFFVDQKVPRAWRDSIPLVVAERGIAWVVGYRVAEWARVRVDSQLICQIRVSPL